MSFSVAWLPAVFDQLNAIYVAAIDQEAVVEALDRINRQLAADPFAVGESRYAEHRIGFDPPLQYAYRVDPTSRTVTVFAVATFGRD